MKTIDSAKIWGRNPEFRTIGEVCALLDISRKSLYRYAEIAIVRDEKFEREWKDGLSGGRRKITLYQISLFKEIRDERNQQNPVKKRDW